MNLHKKKVAYAMKYKKNAVRVFFHHKIKELVDKAYEIFLEEEGGFEDGTGFVTVTIRYNDEPMKKENGSGRNQETKGGGGNAPKKGTPKKAAPAKKKASSKGEPKKTPANRTGAATA